ncbi:MAG: hypothetical protein ACKVP4_01270 [Hyphomicrobium sp.]
MKALFDMLELFGRYWPYAVALVVGIGLAVVDRRVFGRYVFAILLILIAVGGQIAMYVSPFTFSGNDHYFQGLIATLFALAGLAGYALALGTMRMFGGRAA